MPTKKRSTILVVGGNEPIRNSIIQYLQNEGFEVLSALTGMHALKRALRRPDFILLDVGLLDIDGFEVCRRIKTNPETASIPVVFLSASHLSQQAVEKGHRAGGFAFLFHPVDVQSLVAVIHASIARAKAARRARRRPR